jgi:hypothetical protein
MPLEMGSAANLGSCVKYYRHVAYSEGVSLHEHVAVGTATSLLWEESPTSLEVVSHSTGPLAGFDLPRLVSDSCWWRCGIGAQ